MKRTMFIILTTIVVMLGMVSETYAKEKKESLPVEDGKVISQTTKSIKFKWQQVKGVTEYIVYRMDNKKDGYIKIATTKALSMEDKNLRPGTKYTYKIYSCTDISGKSVKAKMPYKFEAYTKGQSIELSIAYTTQDSVKCTWKKVKAASGYELRVYDKNKKCIRTIDSNENSYIVDNLSYDTAYKFRVRYYVKSDSQSKVYSVYSPYVSARAILMKPDGSIENMGSSSFSIKWDKIKDASEYIVFSYDKDTDKKKEVARTTQTTYKVKGLKEGITRKYVIRAVKTKNGHNYYGKYSDIITCGTKPSKVNVTVTSENMNSVSVRWDKVKTADVYVIYSVDKNGNKIDKLAKTNNNSINITGLKSGKKMRIIVCSYRKIDGVNYGVSSGINPTLIYTKPAPSVVKPSLDNKGNLTLRWDKVYGADGYNIYKFNSKNGKYEKIKEVDKCIFIDKIGTKHADASYIVRAYLNKDNGMRLIGAASKVCGVITNCKGIDISHWQDDIDWKKVADSGVKFAIIKIGGRDRARGKIKVDKRYVYNIKQARKNGIKVGVYFYSTAINKREAVEEANWTIKQLKSHDIELPVAFDYEDYVIPSSRTFRTTKSQRTNIAMAFMKTIEDAGYKSLMYGNMSAVQFDFIQSKISKYQLWVARYPRANYGKKIDAYKPDIGGDYAIWQYSETGVVKGIKEKVDMNYCYKLFY